jgi:hypothetical protein
VGLEPTIHRDGSKPKLAIDYLERPRLERIHIELVTDYVVRLLPADTLGSTDLSGDEKLRVQSGFQNHNHSIHRQNCQALP